MLFLITTLALFFALNMGGSSFAASFASGYGGRVVTRWQAAFYFAFFALIGGLFLGSHVAYTLGPGLTGSVVLSEKMMVLVLISAGLSLFTANLMKIPQTTSIVTVAAISGVAWQQGFLNVKAVLTLIPLWILFPLACFTLTWFLCRFIYPPRKANFWVYERLVNHQKRLRRFVWLCCCYNAFSAGTNNVANVVAPVMGAWPFSLQSLFLVAGAAFGLGSVVFPGPIKTAGDKIVPLGLLTAAIISLVSGTIMILASYWGIPQSFVMLKLGAIFAVALVKKGADLTWRDPILHKTMLTWTINPLLTLGVSFVLALIFLGDPSHG